MERVLKPTSSKTLIILLLFLLCSAQSSFATTVVIPSDDDMIIGARAILTGKVVAVESSLDEQSNRIYTYITVKVREVLKGQISERRIVLKELGGQVGDRVNVIYGNPQFKKGEKVLLYLDTWADGSLRTYQMFLGKFNIVNDPITGRETTVRSSPDENTTVLKHQLHQHSAPGKSTERQELSRYMRMVKNRLAANWERSVQFEAETYGNTPPLAEPAEYRSIADRGGISANFTFLGPFRFFEPDSGAPVSVSLNPNPSSGEGVPQVTLNSADVAAAGSAWSNIAGSALQVSYSGALGQCYLGSGLPGVHVVSNNCDGRNAPTTGCAGILAWGGVSLTGSQTKTINGTTFRQTVQGFVSMNPWAACSFGVSCNVREVLTHEIGHAIGLGHSQFSDATMAAFAHFDGRCASIRTDDADGIRAIYPGSGGGTGPLTITTSALAGGTVGSSYSQTLIASGGTPPYGWSLVAGLGTLPPGLSLSGGGAITGTPNAVGTYNFTVRVTDNAAGAAQKALSIVVSAGSASLNSQFVSQSVPTTLQPGQVFTVNMQFLNTGTQTWSGAAYFFASQNPALNHTWGGNAVPLAGFVAGPNQVLDVNFTATAPTTPGTYNFQWQMYQNGGIGFFGQMSTNVAIQVGASPVTVTTGSPLPGGTVASAYSQVLSASGGTAPYTWSVVAGGGSLPTGLSLSTGGVISGNPQTAGTFNFAVRANDSASGFAQKAFAITIGAAPTPVTITTPSPLPGGTSGSAYSQTLSASGGTPPYSWSVVAGAGQLPAGLSLSTGGVVSGNAQTAGTFTFTVQANDSASGFGQKAFAITIAAAPTPVTVTTGSPLPGGTVGSAYSRTLAASGGTAPYTWGIVPGTGSLPTGLSLSTGGVISGNPQTAGTFNFTVQANDSASGSGQKAFVITIVTAPAAVTVTTGSPLSGGTVGSAYSRTLSASGGTAPYTWSLVAGSGSLPTGLSLSAGGVISGDPQTAGTFNFTVQANDSASGVGQKTFAITIAPAPTSLSIPGPGLLAAIRSSQFNFQLSVLGGTPAFTWGVISGGLPQGIVLSPNTGLLSGVPTTSGLWGFTIQVTDAAGAKGQRGFTLEVAPATLLISDATTPESEVGVEFSFQLSASGGTSPYLWGVVAGSLPPGVTLSTDAGLISGTPTQSGIFSFTVHLTDAHGAAVSKSFSITVAAGPLRLLSTLLESVSRNLPYSEDLAAAGGTPPYTWSLSEGVLPPGLMLDAATGVIFGTATQDGWFPLTVRVTDHASNTVTSALDITVAERGDMPRIEGAIYKKGSQKLVVNGINFDKKGVLLVDGVAVSGKIKPRKVKGVVLPLAPGTHTIRIVTSARLVSNIFVVTVTP